jgi:serine/threonine protein kinase
MADPGGVLLAQLLDAPLSIDVFLRIATGIAVSVAHFHARGFIHRDLKPGYILVDQVTGLAWLAGFGLTLRQPRQRQSPDPVEILAGTLAYMAPEQTGRMNRSVDSRSDLYALGVVFYEMLVGELPFVAVDPMDLMHFHLARRPSPPNERSREVPAHVSAIVMKLLAKAPEDRYQTAAGLERDLLRCAEEWSRNETAAFPLGEHDDVGRLVRPEKLYGREREVDTLVERFTRACRGGPPEIVMVSGYSGIGKSSVVHELHRALVPPRGLFASGKFDQYTRDVPYATLAQTEKRTRGWSRQALRLRAESRCHRARERSGRRGARQSPGVVRGANAGDAVGRDPRCVLPRRSAVDVLQYPIRPREG